MIIHNDIVQRTQQWLDLKAGKISASKIAPLMAPRGLGKQAHTLALEVLSERITGALSDNPVTWAMERGIELEPEARKIYSEAIEKRVIEIGGFEDGDLWFSPDGCIDEDGLCEIKCPLSKKHMEILLSDTVLPEYIPQLQFGLMISGRDWIDFVSYNPDFPDQYAMKVIGVHRDDNYIQLMKDRIDEFRALISMMEKKLNV